MSSSSASKTNSILGVTGLVLLLAAGIVLAVSWAVPFPGVVLAVSWLIAFLAMGAVIISAFRQARSAGIGFWVAVGRSFKALGRFIYWFF